MPYNDFGMDDVKNVKYGAFYAPCFLSRMTDREPHQKSERCARVMTAAQIRQDILHNIRMILNSKSRMSDAELGEDRTVTASVLGFGLQDFCGENKSDASVEKLKKGIVDQLVCFEPRIIPSSIQVKMSGRSEELNYICEFEISGTVDAAALSGEILLRSSLDLETGAASVSFAE